MDLMMLFQSVVKHDPLWAVLDATVLRVPRALDRARLAVERQRGPQEAALREIIDRMCGSRVVQRGLFRGLRFPPAGGSFSALPPMFLGTYEHELMPTFEHLGDTRDYEAVVDVGCAEGYYAVGLARRYPACRVIAYDIDPVAQRYCAEMAALNGVADRVSVRGRCDLPTLVEALAPCRRSLILSDCEGYEKHLFSAGAGAALARHDIVIELHDVLDMSITPHLKRELGPTHELTIVSGDDDVGKAWSADSLVPELAGCDESVKRTLVGECRGGMRGRWLVATSRV